MEPVYHLALKSEWLGAVESGKYERSTRGMTLHEVGFIHASTAEQVAATAERFYADCVEPLLVLTIDPTVLAAQGIDMRFEDVGNGELFPHLFGALPVEAVIEVRPGSFDDQGLFVIA